MIIIWGDFGPIFGEKLALFLKTNAMILFLPKSQSFE
jgi:hypothetical protein